MNQRENILKVLRHEKPETTPVLIEAACQTGWYSANESAQRGEEVRPGIFTDCFGCEWDCTHGQPTPYPGNYVLDDITEWRDAVQFPDVDSWDWEAMAAMELKDYNRDEQILLFFNENGIFDRISTLMGFEECLIAMLEEPDEFKALGEAIADHKIRVIKQVAKHFKPDMFMYTDDIAKIDGLFMSANTYRELIKPAQSRIIDAIHENGMLAMQHTCGKPEEVIGDYVEIGVDCWFPAQACNDVRGLIEKYGEKLVFCGGFDSQGPVGRDFASEELTREEARRCVDEYATAGSYICLPMIGNPGSATDDEMRRIGWFMDEFHRYCAERGC